MSRTTYMVIERFRDGGAKSIYERFRERGRLAPDGLSYVANWVDADLRCCYQIMTADDPALLEPWMSRWRDLIEFEGHEVVTTDEAVARVFSRTRAAC